jgi:hypothetical protein
MTQRLFGCCDFHAAKGGEFGLRKWDPAAYGGAGASLVEGGQYFDKYPCEPSRCVVLGEIQSFSVCCCHPLHYRAVDGGADLFVGLEMA